jgi:CHASE3 domain sensor protein
MDAFTLSLTNAEAAQRGFIITGDPAYLEPLEQRFDATRRSVQRLMALTQDNADQQQRLASLPALVSQRFADL